MGVQANLVDRTRYDKSATKEDDLKNKISEKLKFVLSNQDSFDPHEGLKKQKMSKKFNVPQSFIAYNKIERFGGKIADPFELNTHNKQEIESRVFTSKHDQTP